MLVASLGDAALPHALAAGVLGGREPEPRRERPGALEPGELAGLEDQVRGARHVDALQAPDGVDPALPPGLGRLGLDQPLEAGLVLHRLPDGIDVVREHVVVRLLGKRYRLYPRPVRGGPAALPAAGRGGLAERVSVPEEELRQPLLAALQVLAGVVEGAGQRVMGAKQIQQYGRPGEVEIPGWLKAEHLYGVLWLTTPKTRAAHRFVPVSESLWERLWARIDRLAIGPHELVFTNQLGHPVRNCTERYHWRKALEAAGLPMVTVHSARHWTASMTARAKMPDDARTAIMGHTSITMTNHYTHRDTASLAELLDQAIPDLHDDVIDAEVIEETDQPAHLAARPTTPASVPVTSPV